MEGSDLKLQNAKQSSLQDTDKIMLWELQIRWLLISLPVEISPTYIGPSLLYAQFPLIPWK